MKRILIATALLLAATGAQAQSTCGLDLVAVGTGNWLIYRDSSMTPEPVGAIRDVQVAIRTGLLLSMQNGGTPFYPTGTLRYRTAIQCFPGDTVIVPDTVYVPSDTMFVPVPGPTVHDTVFVIDTVYVPVVPDTTPEPSGRLEVNTHYNETMGGYDVEISLYDAAGAPDPAKQVEFTLSAGFFGNPASPWCVGPTTCTRATSTSGRIEVGWRIQSNGDTLTIRAPGLAPHLVISQIDTTTPPPPPPVFSAVDSLRITPGSSIAMPIAVDSISRTVQLFAVIYSANVPYVCAFRGQGNGWYEVEVDSGRTAVYELPGGRFVADASCPAQPLRTR